MISSRPAIIRRLVVLPQPDGPTSTMNSPSPISRLRSSTGGHVAVFLGDVIERHGRHRYLLPSGSSRAPCIRPPNERRTRTSPVRGAGSGWPHRTSPRPAGATCRGMTNACGPAARRRKTDVSIGHEQAPACRAAGRARRLVDVDALVGAYHDLRPDPSDPAQRVAFGTSGHRGSSFRGAFNEAHILATTEAICRYRAPQGLRRPAVHRPRHARPVRAGLADRARGPGGQWRRRSGRRVRRLHADAGRLARDPGRETGGRGRRRLASPTASS